MVTSPSPHSSQNRPGSLRKGAESPDLGDSRLFSQPPKGNVPKAKRGTPRNRLQSLKKAREGSPWSHYPSLSSSYTLHTHTHHYIAQTGAAHTRVVGAHTRSKTQTRHSASPIMACSGVPSVSRVLVESEFSSSFLWKVLEHFVGV